MGSLGDAERSHAVNAQRRHGQKQHADHSEDSHDKAVDELAAHLDFHQTAGLDDPVGVDRGQPLLQVGEQVGERCGLGAHQVAHAAGAAGTTGEEHDPVLHAAGAVVVGRVHVVHDADDGIVCLIAARGDHLAQRFAVGEQRLAQCLGDDDVDRARRGRLLVVGEPRQDVRPGEGTPLDQLQVERLQEVLVHRVDRRAHQRVVDSTHGLALGRRSAALQRQRADRRGVDHTRLGPDQLQVLLPNLVAELVLLERLAVALNRQDDDVLLVQARRDHQPLAIVDDHVDAVQHDRHGHGDFGHQQDDADLLLDHGAEDGSDFHDARLLRDVDLHRRGDPRRAPGGVDPRAQTGQQRQPDRHRHHRAVQPEDLLGHEARHVGHHAHDQSQREHRQQDSGRAADQPHQLALDDVLQEHRAPRCSQRAVDPDAVSLGQELAQQ